MLIIAKLRHVPWSFQTTIPCKTYIVTLLMKPNICFDVNKTCYLLSNMFTWGSVVIAQEQLTSWTEIKIQLIKLALKQSADPSQTNDSIVHESVDIIYGKMRSRAEVFWWSEASQLKFPFLEDLNRTTTSFPITFQFSDQSNWSALMPVQSIWENTSRYKFGRTNLGPVHQTSPGPVQEHISGPVEEPVQPIISQPVDKPSGLCINPSVELTSSTDQLSRLASR